MLCVLKGQKDTECFGRRVDMDTVRSGITITLITFTCWLAAVAAMSVFDPQTEFLNLMYEASSAIGTVGLSADLTPNLSRASHVVLMLLMYIGRIGPLTMALVFAERQIRATSSGNCLRRRSCSGNREGLFAEKVKIFIKINIS